MFVSDIGGSLKGASGSEGGISLVIKGIQATLDMYYNGEHAIEEFSTPANRSKRNSQLERKLAGQGNFPLGDREISLEAELGGVSFSSGPDQLCMISMNSTLWKDDDISITVNGSLGINPAIDFFMEYDPIEVVKGSEKDKGFMNFLEAAVVPDIILSKYRDNSYYLGNMKELWCNIYTDVDRELSFNISISKELKSSSRVPLGVFIIPTVPVSASMELAFEIDFKALGEMNLEIYSKKEDDIVFSVLLDRDLPEPVWELTHDQRTESGFTVQAKLELTTGISLVLSTEVYLMGILGPEVNLGAFVEAKAAVKAVAGFNDPTTVNWKLWADAGLRANATLNLSAFHIDKATWKIWAAVEKEFRKNVYLAPAYLDVISGNNQEGSPGSSLSDPIRVGAYDSRERLITYLPVPIYFDPASGSVSPVKALSSKGIAETEWTLGDMGADHSLTAYFKDGLTRKGDIEIQAFSGGAASLSAEFSASSVSVSTGEIIQFTDQSAGNPTGWDWDFGDGKHSSFQNPTHSYESEVFLRSH